LIGTSVFEISHPESNRKTKFAKIINYELLILLTYYFDFGNPALNWHCAKGAKAKQNIFYQKISFQYCPTDENF